MDDNYDCLGLELVQSVSELLTQGKVQSAEQVLMIAKSEAMAKNDLNQIDLILSELISLYCTTEPKRYDAAEAVSLEREALRRDASSRLQTAMLLYHSVRNPEKAANKTSEAIKMSEEQKDFTSLYSSMSLLGVILLRLRRDDEAVGILSNLEEIFFSGATKSPSKRFVIGDETPFLEALRERNLAISRVARIASILVPLCGDPSFARRLGLLAVF